MNHLPDSTIPDLLAKADREPLSVAEAVELAEAILSSNGCSADVAAILSRNCVAAERDGTFSHGLFRIAGYVRTLRSGWVDGRAVPVVEAAGPALVRADACNGFSQVALDAATPLLLEQARAGVAVLALRNSHHFGALALDVEPFAEQGLIALSVVNSMRQVAPFGATTPIFGTNPIAFAAPRRGRAPFVFDLATSTMSNGDVQLAAREGRTLDEPAGIDRQGAATVDPRAILDSGALVPFGRHKGASLSLMVEILCAAFVGGQFSHEVDFTGFPGAEIPKTGQTLILLNPQAGRGPEADFVSRIEALFECMEDAGVDRLPGERRLAARDRAARDGLRIAAEHVQAMRSCLDV